MLAVTGSTGNVGGAVARALLAAGKQVRALARNRGKASELEALGAEVFEASIEDPSRLEVAFEGTEGVFVMTPPLLQAPDPRTENRLALAGIKHALQASHVPKVVFLSSIGAQHAEGTGLILKAYDMEQELSPLPIAAASIRAAFFMENLLPVAGIAREHGRLPLLYEPLDRPMPMVATEDIGRLAAQLLVENWEGKRTIELEGPRKYSMLDAARIYAEVLGRPVEAVVVPGSERMTMLTGIGMTHAAAEDMVEMVEGFRDGNVAFEGDKRIEHTQGSTTLETLLRGKLTT